jgi:hypothetical protein
LVYRVRRSFGGPALFFRARKGATFRRFAGNVAINNDMEARRPSERA